MVAEPFGESGLRVLRERGIEVVSAVGVSRAALLAALAGADGLIVRSETRVDRELLAAGQDLRVIARAGVGVDAIDVGAATEAAVVVLNAPDANTLAATEQTFALLLALCRHTPRAVGDVRAGIWNRAPLIGTELAGKVLGIVGLGRIGGAVAQRARAFEMEVLATDPFVAPSRAEALGARLLPLEALLGSADIVTLHVPLNPQTRGLVGREGLARLRPHALLVNCARGGLVDEEALLEALDAGVLRGAALDVFVEEPPSRDGTSARLQRHANVVATPHVGGSTREALERIAVHVATDVAGVLLGAPPKAAVNAPIADGPDAVVLRPYVDLAYRLGILYPQVASASTLGRFTLELQGELADMPSDALVVAFLSGLLHATTDRRVSVVNAFAVAAERGIAVDIMRDESAGGFASRLCMRAGKTTLAGTNSDAGLRLVDFDGYEMDAVPAGALVLTQHSDVPGMVGKVGTILGDAAINISAMQVSRNRIGADAAMILAIDRRAGEATIESLRAIAGVTVVRMLQLPGAAP